MSGDIVNYCELDAARDNGVSTVSDTVERSGIGTPVIVGLTILEL